MTIATLHRSRAGFAAFAFKGTWWWAQVDGQEAAVRSTKTYNVSMKCPLCGQISRLRDADCNGPRPDGTQGHHIAWDGMVSPSVQCPTEGCEFHATLRLDGWDEPIQVQGTQADLRPEPPASVKLDEAKVEAPESAPASPLADPQEPTAVEQLQSPCIWRCDRCGASVAEEPTKIAHSHAGTCPMCHHGVMRLASA